VTPEPHSAVPSELQARDATTAMSTRRARRWNRRERERAAKRLMSQAFMEIRALAWTAKDQDDPADALEPYGYSPAPATTSRASSAAALQPRARQIHSSARGATPASTTGWPAA
jgi:hypothetical protein